MGDHLWSAGSVINLKPTCKTLGSKIQYKSIFEQMELTSCNLEDFFFSLNKGNQNA